MAVQTDTTMMPLTCSVYGLYSTEDGVVRYIGQTTQSPKRRLIQHMAEAQRGDTRAHRWMRKVVRNGHDVGVRVIESGCQWDEAERKWIAEFRKTYPSLMTNVSDGGGCGSPGKRSEATRAKMRGPKSESHKARMRKPKSAEARVNMSRGQLGNSKSRGEANRHAVLTEEQVVEIRRRLVAGERGSSIARQYGVKKAAISKIKHGRSWSHIC